MVSGATAVGKHVDVNGVSLYVEEHGQGDPLVLIQPGLLSSASWRTSCHFSPSHFASLPSTTAVTVDRPIRVVT